jgi:hypothetical protein
MTSIGWSIERTAGDERQRRAGAGLDGIASAHSEELSAALQGFSEAMAWPTD